MGIYGPTEHRYCAPVADGLTKNVAFSRFFLERAGRSDWASEFRCLNTEQKKSRKAKFWWKNVFCSEANCKCPNLRGRKVDIFIAYERTDGKRLGLHIECKHPTDVFHDGQAARYRERLSCWTRPGLGPRTIPMHNEAAAILITDRPIRHTAKDVLQFDAVIFFDEIAKFIPIYPLPENWSAH
jgi:hypothetical protein